MISDRKTKRIPWCRVMSYESRVARFKKSNCELRKSSRKLEKVELRRSRFVKMEKTVFLLFCVPFPLFLNDAFKYVLGVQKQKNGVIYRIRFRACVVCKKHN